MVVSALFVTLICSIGVLVRVVKSGTIHYYLGSWDPPWGIAYLIDKLNAYIIVIVAIIAFLVALYSKKSVENEIPEHKIPQLYTLFLLNVTGLIGISATGDLFNLYVLIEIASFSAYALIAVGEKGALYASFRYVVIGTIGACFYLMGVGFIYIMTGTLNMADATRLLQPLYQSRVIHMAFAFLVIGISIKMAMYPLHIWLPDAYTHAPSAISAFMASTMTKVGCYILIRIMYYVFEPYFAVSMMPVATILGWLAVAGMIVASVYAIAQNDFKRMLAYSAVAQIGYIVLGIALANIAGLTGALLHILNEAFTKGCLFLIAGAIMYKLKTRSIDQFKNLFWKMPFTMIAFIIAAFSMIGIPPTCGFFSKLYLLIGSLEAKQWFFVAAILISTVLNVVYFFGVIRSVFFKPALQNDEGSDQTVFASEIPLSMLVVIWIMALGILFFGVFSGQIVDKIIQFAIPKGIL